MSASIFLNISILKHFSLVKKAMEEIIETSIGSNHFEHVYSSKDRAMHTIVINKSVVPSNVKNMLLLIGIKSDTNQAACEVRAVLAYELKKKAVYWKLLNVFYVKHLIKNAAFNHLSDFKKRIEKWM